MSAETAVCRDRGIVLCGGNVYYLVHGIKLGTKYARIFDMKPIKENPKLIWWFFPHLELCAAVSRWLVSNTRQCHDNVCTALLPYSELIYALAKINMDGPIWI